MFNITDFLLEYYRVIRTHSQVSTPLKLLQHLIKDVFILLNLVIMKLKDKTYKQELYEELIQYIDMDEENSEAYKLLPEDIYCKYLSYWDETEMNEALTFNTRKTFEDSWFVKNLSSLGDLKKLLPHGLDYSLYILPDGRIFSDFLYAKSELENNETLLGVSGFGLTELIDGFDLDEAKREDIKDLLAYVVNMASFCVVKNTDYCVWPSPSNYFWFYEESSIHCHGEKTEEALKSLEKIFNVCKKMWLDISYTGGNRLIYDFNQLKTLLMQSTNTPETNESLNEAVSLKTYDKDEFEDIFDKGAYKVNSASDIADLLNQRQEYGYNIYYALLKYKNSKYLIDMLELLTSHNKHLSDKEESNLRNLLANEEPQIITFFNGEIFIKSKNIDEESKSILSYIINNCDVSRVNVDGKAILKDRVSNPEKSSEYNNRTFLTLVNSLLDGTYNNENDFRTLDDNLNETISFKTYDKDDIEDLLNKSGDKVYSASDIANRLNKEERHNLYYLLLKYKNSTYLINMFAFHNTLSDEEKDYLIGFLSSDEQKSIIFYGGDIFVNVNSKCIDDEFKSLIFYIINNCDISKVAFGDKVVSRDRVYNPEKDSEYNNRTFLILVSSLLDGTYNNDNENGLLDDNLNEGITIRGIKTTNEPGKINGPLSRIVFDKYCSEDNAGSIFILPDGTMISDIKYIKDIDGELYGELSIGSKLYSNLCGYATNLKEIDSERYDNLVDAFNGLAESSTFILTKNTNYCLWPCNKFNPSYDSNHFCKGAMTEATKEIVREVFQFAGSIYIDSSINAKIGLRGLNRFSTIKDSSELERFFSICDRNNQNINEEINFNTVEDEDYGVKELIETPETISLNTGCFFVLTDGSVVSSDKLFKLENYVINTIKGSGLYYLDYPGDLDFAYYRRIKDEKIMNLHAFSFHYNSNYVSIIDFRKSLQCEYSAKDSIDALIKLINREECNNIRGFTFAEYKSNCSDMRDIRFKTREEIINFLENNQNINEDIHFNTVEDEDYGINKLIKTPGKIQMYSTCNLYVLTDGSVVDGHKLTQNRYSAMATIRKGHSEDWNYEDDLDYAYYLRLRDEKIMNLQEFSFFYNKNFVKITDHRTRKQMKHPSKYSIDAVIKLLNRIRGKNISRFDYVNYNNNYDEIEISFKTLEELINYLENKGSNKK